MKLILKLVRAENISEHCQCYVYNTIEMISFVLMKMLCFVD